MRYEDRLDEAVLEGSEELERKIEGEEMGDSPSTKATVLSCGGIFIPYKKREKMEVPKWHLLNLPNNNKPLKLVVSGILKDPLEEILEKEHLN
jgi:hypothetical protein